MADAGKITERLDHGRGGLTITHSRDSTIVSTVFGLGSLDGAVGIRRGFIPGSRKIVVMAALPVEVLVGIYLGVLTGIIPALVSWSLGFIFKYFTGVTVPALAVVVLAVAIAGVNGGLLALNDPTVTTAPNAPSIIVAILVVMMMALYAHAQGDKLGASLPKHVSFRKLRERTLSRDVVELVGGRGRVNVTIAGQIEDMEGYPPLSPDLRDEIRARDWTFPADLPLSELETRFADKLRTEFDLADVSVRIDEQARARVVAAPPTSGVSKRVPIGRRAVSVGAMVPTGLARGDDVSLHIDGDVVRGTVVSAQSSIPAGSASVEADGGEPETPPEILPSAPTTEGGDGRITVATTREAANRLLGVDRAHVVVRSRGNRREFELISLLRRAGKRFQRLTVAEDSEFVGQTLGEAAVRDVHDIVVLARRGSEGWVIAPRGSTQIGAQDELFVVGTREAIDRFEGMLA